MHGLNYMILLVSLPLFVVSVDNPLGKCSIKDNECFKAGWESVLQVLGPTGIPEVNAVPIDPMIFNNVEVTVLDGFTLTVINGTLKGFKDCKFDKVSLDLAQKLDTRGIICDSLKIKGTFSFGGKNPFLRSIFGSDSVNGHGDLKAKFENVVMDLKLPVTVIKKENGDHHLKILVKIPQYTFDIQKASFNVKHLLLGGNDISDVASQFLTNSWKGLVQPLGKPIIDQCFKFLVTFANSLYDNVPANEFFIEDLTPYVTNQE